MDGFVKINFIYVQANKFQMSGIVQVSHFHALDLILHFSQFQQNSLQGRGTKKTGFGNSTSKNATNFFAHFQVFVVNARKFAKQASPMIKDLNGHADNQWY